MTIASTLPHGGVVIPYKELGILQGCMKEK
jgi:hypothetical protein